MNKKNPMDKKNTSTETDIETDIDMATRYPAVRELDMVAVTDAVSALDTMGRLDHGTTFFRALHLCDYHVGLYDPAQWTDLRYRMAVVYALLTVEDGQRREMADIGTIHKLIKQILRDTNR